MTDVKTIQQAADDVITGNDIVAPVVNVFDIAAREGISIKRRAFPLDKKNISGFYFEPEKTIYLNMQESAERQAFTVAHELGHYFLKHKPNEYGMHQRQAVYQEGKGALERDADSFAANLLMPEKLVRQEIKKYPFLNSNSASLLAMRFGVSPSAMAHRLKNLNIG